MKENRLQIRSAKIEDLNALINLRKEHFDYEVNVLKNNLLDSSWATSNDSREDFKYFILKQIIFIAEIDDIPVGYGRVRHSSSEYLENVVGAGNLGYGISKEYRGKGYGNILFKELLKKCKEHGYKEIKLFPLKTNEATIEIMMKNGGKIIGDFKGEKHIILIPLQ